MNLQIKCKIKFIYELTKMPFCNLRTEFTEDPQNICVVELDILKVLDSTDFGFELKSFQIDDDMKNLVGFINGGNHLIPPLIKYINNDLWTIVDGKHRIALALEIGCAKIPFLIRKCDLLKVKSLK